MEKIINLSASSSHQAIVSLLMWGWQALLLLGVVWLMKKLHRRSTPALHYKIWLLGLIAIALLPLWIELSGHFPLPQSTPVPLSYVVGLPKAMAPDLSPIQLAAQPDRQVPTAEGGVPLDPGSLGGTSLVWPWLFAAWVIGATMNLLRLCISYRKLHEARISARPISVAELGCAGLDLRSLERVSIGLSSEVQAPLVTGILHPMILLPDDILSWTTVEERVSILQHELAHIERLDHYVNPLQAMLTMIFFFHPMVRYACHQLNIERELACDERVLSLGVAPTTYAESILKVAERNVLPDLVHQPASFASRKTLQRRVAMILRENRLPVLTRHWPFLVLPVVLLAVIIWLVTGHHAAAGYWPGQADDNQRTAVQDNRPSVKLAEDPALEGASQPDGLAIPNPGLSKGRPGSDKPLPANKNADNAGLADPRPQNPPDGGSTPRLAAPQLVDPSFEAFSLARGPIFGWYADDPLHPNDKRFGRVTMTQDSSTKVTGAYSLHIDQLEPRPPGRGQVFLSQAVRLPAGETVSRRFELSVQMQGRMDGPVTIDIYVWEPNQVAKVIAKQVVSVNRSWSTVTLTFNIPPGYDQFGIWFYLPPEQEAQLWLDDVQLRSLAGGKL
jgi:beta-lactamase regulating signal transducer with metallopeptidase domain